MSCRRPQQTTPTQAPAGFTQQQCLDVQNLRAALDAHASQTAALSAAGYYDVSDHRPATVEANLSRDLDVDMHPAMLPPEYERMSAGDIDAWYDGIVKAAKKGAAAAKEAVQKGVKMAKDNSTAPRMIMDGKMKIPSAIHDLYTRTLQYPQDDDGHRFIVNGFIPAFEMKKSYSGKKLTKHAEYIEEVKALAKKYGPKIKVDITHIFESSAGDWIPGGLKGMKLYTVVSQVSAPKLPEDTMIDIIFLQRDTSDNGDWKIKKIIHDGTFDTA